jgi:hypothetical protein
MHSTHMYTKLIHIGLIMFAVRLFHLENSWTEFDEIWYGRYAALDSYILIFCNG